MTPVYQSFIDDSDAGRGGPFVLAGFVATDDAWATFSEEWGAALRTAKPRPITYFKAKEAASRRGQFTGWKDGERDALIRQLIGILEQHALFGIGTLLDNDAYQKVFKVKLARAMDYPYTLAFYDVMHSLFTVQDKQGWQQPVDFIFDEQGKQIDRAIEAWDDFVKFARPENQRRLGQRPVSGDDKICLPLQAADLLAWRVRREWMDKGKQSGADYAVKLFPLSLYIYVHEWTEEKFQMQMAGFQRFKRATGRKFLYDP